VKINALSKVLGFGIVAALVSVGLVLIPNEQEKAEAVNGSMFNPGLIISDSVFYDSGAMSVTEIQRFLDSQVTNCLADAAGPACLKDYKVTHPAVTGSAGRCASLPAQNNISAAQLIFDVARACGINPKVILVKLQKEQGLITSTRPSARAYDFALGMNCPDIGGCSASTAGFFWQLYRGAGQLNYYSNPAGPFTWLRVGAVISRPYYPTTRPECGSQSFRLENKATAALYYYTPYVPNQAALNNLSTVGDWCSSYGNRNFWRDYNRWFGSTIGGGFVINDAAGTSFLIVNQSKFRIRDSRVLSALAPLGPANTVPAGHLESFVTAGDIGPLVQDAAGAYLFIDQGRRFRFSNCQEVASYGLDCAQAVRLTNPQLAALPLGSGSLTSFIRGTANERYIIQAGELREILNDASLTAAGISLPAASPVSLNSVSYLAQGVPVIADRSLVANRDNQSVGIFAEGRYFPIDPAIAGSTNFAAWFQGAGSSLGAGAIARLTVGPTITAVVADESGKQFTIAPTGKLEIVDPNNLVANAPVIPASILNSIPTATGDTVAPAPAPAPAEPAPAPVVPDPAPVAQLTYTVVAGDTLWAISRRFGTTVSRLEQLNNIRPGAFIRIGQVLTVEGSAAPVAPAPVAPAPVAPAPAPEPASQPTYTVVAGDTLWAIARRFGTTVSRLEQLNNLRPGAILRIRQVLIIEGSAAAPSAAPAAPAPGPVATANSYRVVAGDTLWAISRRFGTTVSRLEQLNNLRPGAIIRIGQVLRLS
jgi:LysM repeat protein